MTLPPVPRAGLATLTAVTLAATALLASACTATVRGRGQAGHGQGPAGTQPRVAVAHRGAAPAARRPPSPAATPGGRLPGRQLVTVTASRYGATYATLTAYGRIRGRWRRALGPWTARIGRGGFAPPGHKREGDGRTPPGAFGIKFLFGVLPDPGVRFSYRQANAYDFWDDDPASPHYNEWVDSRHADPGKDPEPMDVSGYGYGAAIAYNTARTPGLGSAIFLHVNIGIATAGCVTLPGRELLAVLRWLDPRQSPRITMGVR